jgi:hypothetical protein
MDMTDNDKKNSNIIDAISTNLEQNLQASK